jgi:hypothetical protein
MSVVATLVAILITVSGAQPADDSGVVISKNCWSFTPACTTVFSRSNTKHRIGPAASGVGNGLLATVVGLCAYGGGKNGAAICTAIFGAYNGSAQAAISLAVANNECAAYTTYFSDSLPGIWSADNGPDCHN